MTLKMLRSFANQRKLIGSFWTCVVYCLKPKWRSWKYAYLFDTQMQKKNSLLLGITDRVFICQYFKNANVIRMWERKV